MLTSKKDLYGIEEFFDNYTTKNPKRNYKIYCTKYEDFFNNISEFNKVLNIKDNKKLYPIEKTTNRNLKNKKELEDIYSNLIDKMKKMKFIHIA